LTKKHNFAFMKKHCFLFCMFFVLTCSTGQKIQKLTPQEIKKDVSHFKSILFKGHVDIFSIAPTTKIDSLLDAIIKKYQDSGAYRYQLFTELAQVMHYVNDVHSSIQLREKYNDYYLQHEKILPLHVYYEKGHLHVKDMLHDSIKKYKGKIILNINGISADSILKTLILHSNIDGTDTLVAKKIASLYFFSYYPLLFTCKDSNSVVLQVDSQQKDTVVLPAVDYKNSYVKEKKDVETNLSFIFLPTKSAAYLKIPTFMNFWTFQNFLRDAFVFIKKNKVSYLILDLRDNGGGILELAKKLIKYLIPEETIMVDYVRTKSSHILQQEIIKKSIFQPEITKFFSKLGGKVQAQLWKKKDQEYKIFVEKKVKPSRYVFTGKLYVLMNSYCASATGLVLNVLRQRPNTILVGTPAVCTISGSFGNPTQFSLPHSHIEGTVSAIFIRQNHALGNTLSPINIRPHIHVEDSEIPSKKIHQLFQFLQEKDLFK